MRWPQGRNRWPGSQSQRGMWQLLLSPTLEKEERYYIQQYFPVGHCSSLVFFNNFLIETLYVSNSKQYWMLAKHTAAEQADRTPCLLTCLAEKGHRVQHRREVIPSNFMSVRHPQTSEQIGHTTADSAFYHYSSCSICKFTKPLPCKGKCESRQEGTATGDNCWEITALSA